VIYLSELTVLQPCVTAVKKTLNNNDIDKTLPLWNGVLPEKLSVVVVVKKFTEFYGSRSCIILFTPEHASGPSPKRDESSPRFPIPLLYDSF
jgi:hypothetical protein